MSEPTEERPSCILLDSPIGPLSPPEEIHAWLEELDAIEATVAPDSEATETIKWARWEARQFSKFQAEIIASGQAMIYAPARRRPGR